MLESQSVDQRMENPSNEEAQLVGYILQRIRQELDVEANISWSPGSLRIILGQEATSRQLVAKHKAVVAITDWDNTIEPYTERKGKYHQGLSKLFLQKILGLSDSEEVDKQTKLLVLLQRFNKLLRYQKPAGQSKIYSPTLEMLATTWLWQELESDQNRLQEIFSLNDQELLGLLARQIFSQPPVTGWPQLAVETIGTSTSLTTNANLLSELDFTKCPAYLNESVFNFFRQAMTGNNLLERELAQINFNPKVYWVISTFGSPSFQLEKVLSGLQAAQAKEQRLPDEINLVYQGHKDGFLRQLVKNLLEVFAKKPILFFDDSSTQLGQIKPEDGITVCQVVNSQTPAIAGALKGETTGLLINLQEDTLANFANNFLLDK